MDLNGGNQFESLKREATKLERQLEEKVARYQQVCTMCYVWYSAATLRVQHS